MFDEPSSAAALPPSEFAFVASSAAAVAAFSSGAFSGLPPSSANGCSSLILSLPPLFVGVTIGELLLLVLALVQTLTLTLGTDIARKLSVALSEAEASTESREAAGVAAGAEVESDAPMDAIAEFMAADDESESMVSDVPLLLLWFESPADELGRNDDGPPRDGNIGGDGTGSDIAAIGVGGLLPPLAAAASASLAAALPPPRFIFLSGGNSIVDTTSSSRPISEASVLIEAAIDVVANDVSGVGAAAAACWEPAADGDWETVDAKEAIEVLERERFT